MSKYIKWFGFALLLFCVIQQPKKVNAKMYDYGQGFSVDVYEAEPDSAVVSVLSKHIPMGTETPFAVMAETWETHEQYLIFGYGTYQGVFFNRWLGGNDMVFCTMPGYWWVYKMQDGEWVQTYYYPVNPREQETGIRYQDDKLKLYVFREWTGTYLHTGNTSYLLWSKNYPAPTVTPIPSPTPTLAPVSNVDVSDTGFVESMSVALEFMRIPIEIAGFEVNMFEIMMFGFACTIVIYLVFAPVKK